jgi:hypothetical protein
MEFKAKRRKLKVTIDDKTYSVRFPHLGEMDEYRRSVKDKSEDEQQEALLELIASFGLPREAILELEVPDFKEIVHLLTDQKN